jgi:hypothetical protein
MNFDLIKETLLSPEEIKGMSSLEAQIACFYEYARFNENIVEKHNIFLKSEYRFFNSIITIEQLSQEICDYLRANQNQSLGDILKKLDHRLEICKKLKCFCDVIHNFKKEIKMENSIVGEIMLFFHQFPRPWKEIHKSEKNRVFFQIGWEKYPLSSVYDLTDDFENQKAFNHQLKSNNIKCLHFLVDYLDDETSIIRGFKDVLKKHKPNNLTKSRNTKVKNPYKEWLKALNVYLKKIAEEKSFEQLKRTYNNSKSCRKKLLSSRSFQAKYYRVRCFYQTRFNNILPSHILENS